MINIEIVETLLRDHAKGLTENSRSWIFNCPLCDKSEKLFMLKTTGRFVCWRCKETDGYEGNPEFVLKDVTGFPLAEIKRRIYGVESYQSGFLSSSLKDFWGDDEMPVDNSYVPVPVFYKSEFYDLDHKWSKRGLEYLAGRGVDLDLARRYDLKYSPPDRRIIIPIKRNGELYGWQARAVFDTEGITTPKILTLNGLTGKDENIRKDKFLMFEDRLIGSRHAVVCEGPFDGIKADKCGGNVVTMGKAISRVQLGILQNSGIEKLYIALDPDASLEVRNLAHKFSHIKVYFMDPLDGKADLGEMTTDETYEAFLRAVRYRAGMLHGRLMLN